MSKRKKQNSSTHPANPKKAQSPFAKVFAKDYSPAHPAFHHIPFLSEWLLPCLFFLLYSYFLLRQSPNSPASVRAPYTDSSVHIYIARLMLAGGVPYRDCFDHHGPTQYIINFLGLLLHERYGIYILEHVFLFFSMLLSYKTLRNTAGLITSLFSVLLAFSYLLTQLEGGNFMEEFALFFQIAALYTFTGHLLQKREIGRKQAFLLGFCFCIVLLARANLAFSWIPFCAFIFIQALWKKHYQDAGMYVLFFLAGIAAFALPIFLYFSINHGLGNFLHDYLWFNLRYVSRNQDASIAPILSFFLTRFVKFCLVCSIASVFLLLLAAKRLKINLTKLFQIQTGELSLHLLNLACLLLGFWIVVMPKNTYAHYSMCLIPHTILPIAFIAGLFFKNAASGIAALALAYYFLWAPLYDVYSYYLALLQNQPNYSYRMIADYVQKNTEETERILVVGGIECQIYNLSNRFAASRYAYRPSPMLPEMQEEFEQGLRRDLPALLISRNMENDVYLEFQDEYELAETILDEYYIFRRISS